MEDLDTQMLVDGWFVHVKGEAYGPYRQSQMGGFIAEGRVQAHTLVSRRRDGEYVPAKDEPLLAHEFGPRRFHTQAAKEGPGEPANIIVYCELVSAASMIFEHELFKHAHAMRVGSGLWVARTRLTAGQLRNHLSPVLQRGDRMMLADATRNRLAWFNLGPEIEVRLRDVWNCELEQPATAE